MARKLAVLEGMCLMIIVTAMIVIWHPLNVWRPIDYVIVLGKGFAVSLCCVVAFYYNDLYDFRIVGRFADFAARLVQSFGVAFILLAGFYTIFPQTNLAGGPFVSSLIVIVGLMLPLRAISYSVMRSRRFVERIVVLGMSPLTEKLIEAMVANPNSGYELVGVVEDADAVGPTPPPVPLLGPIRDLIPVIQRVRADRVVVALANRRGRLPVRDLLEARTLWLDVEEGVELYERLTGKLAIEALTPSNLIFSRDFTKSRLTLQMARFLSCAVSAIGLLTLWPLMAIIALAIKLDSRGPVFFVHERVGLHGRSFRLLKFRTMHPGEDASAWVRDNTERITRVGRWLRTFRLDEVPQFVNILRGDMNLVGPRPHPVSNYRLFVESIPYYSVRASVRPGVTGWAQIRHGYANDLEEETEKMRYDLFYIKHLSAWVDLRILFDTVKIVLFGRGTTQADAYAAAAPAVTNGQTAGPGRPGEGSNGGNGHGRQEPEAVDAVAGTTAGKDTR